MTKFGLMRSRKGEIILEEDSRQWKNSAIKRPRVAPSTSVSFLFWRVTELQGMIENILCLQVFSLKVLKFDLYLSQQSISRALKIALKRAYLMIVGQSLHLHSHLSPARVKHEFQRMTGEILCIQVLFANCFQFWFS